MEKIKKLLAHKIFRIFMWVFLFLVGIYVILVIYRVFYFFDLEKTNKQVEKIHNEKITMDDVVGKNLPPDPGVDADKTVEGIDANKNGIRDDVEIAIFKKYPNSAKTRGALLQYALASQMQINQPFMNTTLATEIAREHSRGFQCVGELVPNDLTPESFDELDALLSFIDDLVFNTDARNKKKDSFYLKVRGSSDLNKEDCDIDYSKL